MKKLIFLTLTAYILLVSCSRKKYYKYDIVRKREYEISYDTRIFCTDEEIFKSNYYYFSGLDSLYNIDTITGTPWCYNNIVKDLYTEGGLFFRLDTNFCDTVDVNGENIVIKFLDFDYKYKYGNIYRDSIVMFKLLEVDNDNWYSIYFFDRNTKLFLGWEFYLKDTIIRFEKIVNESRIDARTFDMFNR